MQEGCDKFCSFCVVPYTRGAETSRPVAKVLAEIARLADAGAREFTLLGQNVNAYHGRTRTAGAPASPTCSTRAAQFPGVLRLRYSTSHPLDMDEEPDPRPRRDRRARALSASAGAVGLRPHSRGDEPPPQRRATISTSSRACAAPRPDIAFSSDFIVGFPGETDADFEATLALVREVGFASAYAFKYSPRPGHARRRRRRPGRRRQIKAARLAALQQLLDAQRQAFNRATVGRRFDVVFDKPGRHEGQLIGRTPYMQSVHADGGPFPRSAR